MPASDLFQGLCRGFILERQRPGVAPLEVDDIAEVLAEKVPERGLGVAPMRIGDCSEALAAEVMEVCDRRLGVAPMWIDDVAKAFVVEEVEDG